MVLPTTEPVGEQILADIETTLLAIDVAHVTAAFWNTVRYVYRGQISYPNIDGHPACVVWLESNETADDLESQTHSLNMERMEFQIDGWLQESSNVPRALQRFAADIRTALMLDPKRGGPAFHTFITSQRFFYAAEISEPFSKVEVDVSVVYRTRVDDLTISN